MDERKLNKYLDEIGRETLLTEAEEQALAARIREGDEQALQRLAAANLRLVVSLAGKYQGKGLTIDDLVSEGNIGLMKAARKYDARPGVRFAAYATGLIRQQIEKALKAESAEQRVELTRSGATRSVDAPLGTKANVSLLSVLVDGNSPLADERVYSTIAEKAIEHALYSLDDRERCVVTAYFGLGQDHLTMAEIAQEMGLKRERVRQIRDRAVRRMKKAYRAALH